MHEAVGLRRLAGGRILASDRVWIEEALRVLQVRYPVSHVLIAAACWAGKFDNRISER